ncbi:hypothetical protein OKA04_14720 [Luteolibacter flavescens]|uniref:Uncharacterized protein n=1 Tax=Luteolibacter flavescens TaxID=1859460 RepID=A0ABT3FQX7_9BACT|nr:hypothetical protein [Luteolibacter flavescens]MCW1885990.1 hypothetical protein [Luteolibacter flavescens]
MKWNAKSMWSRLRAGGFFFTPTLAALWLSACAPQAPYGPPGRSNQDFIGALPNVTIPDIPAEPSTDVSNIVTAGNRSGLGAVNRNSIDAILNDPKPAATRESKPRQKAAEERPGLATAFGDSVVSPWYNKSFTRESSKPDGTGVVFYNNREGIDAMTGSKWKMSPLETAAGEKLEWGIKGGFRYLPTYKTWTSDQRRFVVGKNDGHYSIVLKNRCKSRLEVVLSVDGLDVMDGKKASFAKRGYIIDPNETLEVKGWRTSPETVARFRFSTVAGSYANLAHGDHRNVGVIGLAVFTEKGVDPWTWMPQEVNDRLNARPFTKAP